MATRSGQSSALRNRALCPRPACVEDAWKDAARLGANEWLAVGT